jgi:hypothetical protein
MALAIPTITVYNTTIEKRGCSMDRNYLISQLGRLSVDDRPVLIHIVTATEDIWVDISEVRLAGKRDPLYFSEYVIVDTNPLEEQPVGIRARLVRRTEEEDKPRRVLNRIEQHFLDNPDTFVDPKTLADFKQESHSAPKPWMHEVQQLPEIRFYENKRHLPPLDPKDIPVSFTEYFKNQANQQVYPAGDPREDVYDIPVHEADPTFTAHMQRYELPPISEDLLPSGNPSLYSPFPPPADLREKKDGDDGDGGSELQPV